MGILGPVIEPPAHLAPVLAAQFLHRRRVGSQAVGDDCLDLAVPLQRLLHERKSRGFVAFPGDVALENFALLINHRQR